MIDILDASPDTVPVVNERSESDKFRLQWRLVPGTGSDFPESSLTLEEKVKIVSIKIIGRRFQWIQLE